MPKTGKQCSHCKETKDRVGKNGRCLDCERERIRLYRAAHPDKARESSRLSVIKYRTEKPEQARLSYRRTGGQWRARNRERERQRVSAWKTEHPEVVSGWSAKRRATARTQLDPSANPQAIRELHREAALASAFMGEAEPRGFAVDHIVPLKRGGRHHEENLRVLPARLNSVKGAKLDSEVDSPEFHRWLDPQPTFEQVAYRVYRLPQRLAPNHTRPGLAGSV